MVAVSLKNGLDVEVRRIDPAGGDVHLDLVELRPLSAWLLRRASVLHPADLALDLAAVQGLGGFHLMVDARNGPVSIYCTTSYLHEQGF